MRAAKEGRPYHQQFPIDSDHPSVEVDIDARRLWKKIIHNAWQSAEPGVLFWDTIIRESIPDCYRRPRIQHRLDNPCGEIPLCPYDSCRLLAINLLSYVEKPFTPEAYFNFDLFKKHVEKAMRMMDDIIDLELEKVELIINKVAADPEEADIRHVEYELWKKIREMAVKGRRTGLGITAEGRHARSARPQIRIGRGHRLRRQDTEDAGGWRHTAHRSPWPRSAEHSPSTTPHARRTTP